MEFLISKDTKGKFRYVILDEAWNDEQHCYIISKITSQYKGKETIQPEKKIFRGKVNRTVTEQSRLEYQSAKKKYKDKGYIEVEKHPNEYSIEELDNLFGDVKTNQFGIIKPQLAKQADKVTNKKIFDKEWMISRKLDGVKALFYYKDGEVHTASRGGGHYDYSTEHLRTDQRLVAFFKENPNAILDGELFKRGKSLQQISGAARMEKNAYDCDWLEYWVYDCYITNLIDVPADGRYKFLIDRLSISNDIPIYDGDDSIESSIKLLEQDTVVGWSSMILFHNNFVENGFEGAVIKDPSKPYKPDSRCNNLIKIKMYKDSTVRIIDKEEGLRGAEDMVFICQMKDGTIFKAKPFGTREDKEEYWNNFDELCKDKIGELKYFYLSDSGVPLQPSMKCIRYDIEEPEL